MSKQDNFTKKALAAGAITALAFAGSAQAQSSDALLNKLVDKGVLTTKEADDLRKETQKDADKAFGNMNQQKSGLPDWVSSLKFYGDLRLRYESIFIDSGDFPERSRFRYRIRPGFTAMLKDNFEVGMRLTSSEPSGAFGGDPVSGNTSFSDNGSKKFVYLDLAYAKWHAIKTTNWNLAFTGGKMENPLHFPGTELFDKDYTPEGFAQEVSYRLDPRHVLKVTAVQYILDELAASGKDPALLGGQLRWNAAWDKHWSSTLGGTYLSIVNRDSLITAAVPNQGRGNTRNAAGALVHGFNAYGGDAGLTYLFDSAPLHTGAFPVTISGDYLYNPSAPADNVAYTAGITFGKAGKKHSWQLDYRYTRLEADAWYEEFTESDFGGVYATAPIGGDSNYRSGTNVKGHWVKASYSPADSLTISAAYFFTDLIHPSPSNSDGGAGRLQLDLVWKF